MHDTIAPEYRIVHGSQPKALRRIEQSKSLQRRAHHLVLVATGDGIPDEGFHFWADLRRGRRRIWGGILRVVDQLIDRNMPEALVQMIPSILREYIHDRCADRNPTPPSPTAKVA